MIIVTMPVQRSVGCARVVVRKAMLTCIAGGSLPTLESNLMRIALSSPFSTVCSETTLVSHSRESASSASSVSTLRSDSDTVNCSTNSYWSLLGVYPDSKCADLDNFFGRGDVAKNFGSPHFAENHLFHDGEGVGRRRSFPLLPCHKFGFSLLRRSSTAVDVILENEGVTRGKSWKGKGWNRAPTSEVVGIVTDAAASQLSVSTQFDNIPDLEEKLKFLETCGLGDNQLLQMRKRLPSAVKNTFLKLSMKKLIEVATFLDEEVGVEKKDFGNLLFANPYIAGSSVEECLRPKVEFLRKRGITKEEMGKMVLRSPQILTYSLEGKLLAIEKKLLEVGLKDEEIGRVFVRYPALIGTSIGKFDKNVQSLKEAGISEVARAIFKIPQIMSLSLDNKYKGILQFLQDELNLQSEQISKIVSSQISILSFSVETNIRPKVGFFSEMGLQTDDIARLVVKYPNIFCHSLEKSIKPKVQYLVKEMNLQVMELISFPHYLSYSLPERIRPRYEYVSKYGFNFRLSSLLSCCENVFHKRYPKPPLSVLSGDTLGSVP